MTGLGFSELVRRVETHPGDGVLAGLVSCWRTASWNPRLACGEAAVVGEIRRLSEGGPSREATARAVGMTAPGPGWVTVVVPMGALLGAVARAEGLWGHPAKARYVLVKVAQTTREMVAPRLSVRLDRDGRDELVIEDGRHAMMVLAGLGATAMAVAVRAEDEERIAALTARPDEGARKEHYGL